MYMSHRLQVLLEEDEYRRLRQAARREGTTVAEWVRQALRAGMRRKADSTAERKRGAIAAAIRHSFPAPDIDQMLDEISRGRGGQLPE